jgi:hypothetical protein
MKSEKEIRTFLEELKKQTPYTDNQWGFMEALLWVLEDD